MNRGQLTAPFRKLGLMHAFDKIKYLVQKIQFRSQNEKFLNEHPDFPVPPNYMLFEAFQLNFQKYHDSGMDTAKELIADVSPFKSFEDLNILDWGCGPARVIRHLPTLLSSTCKIFGTDYNRETIAWNRKHIELVHFEENEINPPLNFEDNLMDLIYGLSVFTHLSESNHKAWIDELKRVSAKGAIWYFTSQGEIFKEKMTTSEIEDFDSGKLVIRGNVVEGHRVFSAFHPKEYMQQLFSQVGKVLLHRSGEKKSWGVEQDLWIVQLD